MRGPHDDQIAAQTLVPEAAEAATPRRPPGGKVLVRLLQLLDSAGLVEAAERAVEAAVGGNGQRRTLEALRPRHRDRAAAAPPAVGAAPSTEEVARTYAEAAERLAAAPAAGVPAWRSLGPVTIPNGQTTAPAGSTSRAASPPSRSTRPIRRTSWSARPTAVCGRAATGERPGRRGPTPPRP